MVSINFVFLNVAVIFRPHFLLLNTSCGGFPPDSLRVLAPMCSYAHPPLKTDPLTQRQSGFLNAYGAVAKAHLHDLEGAIHQRPKHFRNIVNSFLFQILIFNG